MCKHTFKKSKEGMCQKLLFVALLMIPAAKEKYNICQKRQVSMNVRLSKIGYFQKMERSLTKLQNSIWKSQEVKV